MDMAIKPAGISCVLTRFSTAVTILITPTPVALFGCVVRLFVAALRAMRHDERW
jgi:hypothetical protein